MHAMKVSWGGQTFALAKCNDSQGKKSRIRRTKEERKTMVESFINKYRTSNNGNFPSLNLTHKEVGGSFYTVREIVREIIQENKVLGPATVSSEHIIDHCSEQDTLKSLTREPHSDLSLSSAIGSATNHGQEEILSMSSGIQSMHDELVTVSRGQPMSRCYEMVESKDWEMIKSLSNDIYIPQFIHGEATGQQKNFYGGQYVNGNMVDEECNEEEARKPSEQGKIRKQEDEPRHSEVHFNKKLEDDIGKQNDDADRPIGSTVDDRMVSESVVSEAKVVMNMETNSISVLRQDQPSIATSNCSLSERSEPHVIAETLQAEKTNHFAEKVDLPSCPPSSDTNPSGDTSSHAVDERTEKDIAPSFSATKSTTTHEFSTQRLSNLAKGTDLEGSISHNDVLNLKRYDEKHLITGVELQPHSAPNDSQIEEAVSVANIYRTRGELFSLGTDQPSSGSSEKTTKKSAEAVETNPILAVINSFIAAFVKFWVE